MSADEKRLFIGMPLKDVEARKGVKKGDLLDRAGSTELAANLFRITQTDEKLQKDRIQGELLATRTHNMVGGKVRQTIKDIGGVLPEDIPAERHIREVKKQAKLNQKSAGNTLDAGNENRKKAA